MLSEPGSRETLVMKGSLDDVELPDVLQVMGGSRQHTVIELCDKTGSRVGVITIKAGQVLNAQSPSGQGRSAFIELFQHAPELFHVFRLPDANAYPTPLGSLAALIFEATDDTPVPEAREEPAASQAPAASAPATAEAEPAVAAAPTQVETDPQVAGSVGPTIQPPRPGAGKRRPVVVGVASPKGGVGKTTITLNLALSLAERGVRTVLVDADVNGDILSAVDARNSVDVGAFDLLDRPEEVGDALVQTSAEKLRVLPAWGADVPTAALDRPDLAEAWRGLITQLDAHSDLVLVDCPAGMFHTTSAVLESCSHVVGVFQAEILSSRSFAMFLRGLGEIPRERRPALAGVVVNMFQGRANDSVEAFQAISSQADRHRLFDTTIPRSDAFGAAAQAGQPLRTSGEDASSLAWLFDALAEEVCHRVGVGEKPDPERGAFLL